MTGRHCQHCPLRSKCLPDHYSYRARFVYRGLYQDEIDLIKKRQQTLHYKKKLTEHQWKIEGLFAEAKQNHCLRRAKYRGLEKVQIQCYLIALVQNFKRLILFIFYLYWIANFMNKIKIGKTLFYYQDETCLLIT